MTYAINEATGLSKDLPTPYCNGPSCKSTQPEFLQREPFIEIFSTQYSETDWEWIAYRTAALKNWRKKTSERLWKEKRVDKPMSHSLIMSDNCPLALAKNANDLVDLESLIPFLVPWYGIDKHHPGILACLQSTLPSSPNVPSKLERKAVLTAARTSKKIKYMDDPVVAKAAKITAMRDHWLVQWGKATTEMKARLKKATEGEKKEREKADKAREKSQQQQNIRRLAITNRQQIGSFCGVLSDLRTEASSDLPPSLKLQTPASSQATARFAHQASQAKKKEFVSNAYSIVQRKTIYQ